MANRSNSAGRLAFLITCAGLFLAAGQAAADGDLRAGTCLRDITPVSPSLVPAYEAQFGGTAVVNHSDPVFLAGFGNGRAATGYNDRLWARGIVVDGRGGRIALVALDLIGYFKEEVDIIRDLVPTESGIDYFVVHSTHQHEGPDTLGLWGPDGTTSGIDYAYLDFVNAVVADCVEEAAANLKQARVRYATTDSVGLSLGLDPEDDGQGVGDGKVLAGDEVLAPGTNGRIVNSRLSVMQLTSRGAPFSVYATLVNFASHPESLGSSNTLVTSDFPHYARERLEAEYGGLAMWVSADLGVLQGPLDIDVLDPDTQLVAPRRTFRFAQVHGEQLAERVIASIDQRKPGNPAPAVSYGVYDPVPLRLDNPYTRFFIAIGVLDVRRSLFTDGEPDPSVGFPFPPPFDVIPQALGEDLHSEVGAIRIGDGSFAVVPSELDPQIGETYRSAMTGATHTFIVGLGNDAVGYQLPGEKWDNSCHACAPFVLAGVPQLCPIQPIDCNTVFINNAGAGVDQTISDAIGGLIQDLHGGP